MSPIESEEELTRKQRREQARTERRALEESEAAGAARRKRLQLLGGVAVAVVAVIVLVLVLAGGSGSSNGKINKHEENNVSKEVTALVGGIPQSGNTLGKSTAPVTLVYYGDLECPICKEFTLGALPSIINRYVRSGKVKIEYRNFETATREPETFRKQQIAALAAGKQAKMWNYLETFYHEQGEEDSGYVTESYLDGLAKQVPGLSLAAWQTARGESALASQVLEDTQSANAQGFTGTPSFLIGHTGGAQKKLEYQSLTEPTQFDEAIEKQLKS